MMPTVKMRSLLFKSFMPLAFMPYLQNTAVNFSMIAFYDVSCKIVSFGILPPGYRLRSETEILFCMKCIHVCEGCTKIQRNNYDNIILKTIKIGTLSYFMKEVF